MEFVDIAPVTPSIITVVGVGGGGGNAVNHMYNTGIADVSFIVCNTDRQALLKSPIAEKIQLGEGLGAGNTPEKGRQAALASIEEIRNVLKINDTKMLFITAGMGGGTGTGAAPVIAQAAKEMGILTVAIVTIPFESEGKPRILQAIEGINTISRCVDSLIIINNAHIEAIYGDLPLSEAFGKADDLLATAAKSIADIITQHYLVNVDFADVKKVMSDSGVAVMGSAVGGGENRALEVAQEALKSPLLHHKDIKGARNVLLNITSGTKEVTMSETRKITSFIQDKSATGNSTDLIWGAGYDESLGENIKVTVIATGFEVESIPAVKEFYKGTLGYVSPKDVVKKHEVIDFDDEVPVRRVENSEKTNVESDESFEVISQGGREIVEVESGDETFVTYETPRFEKRVENVIERYVIPEEVIEVVDEAKVEQALVEKSESVTERKRGEKQLPKSIIDMSEDELDDVPAWVRRGIKLDAEVPTSGANKAVSLDFDSDEPTKNNDPKIHHLFD